MHHRVAMSYFPALMRINGPEKQQFYHIYSLERHAVTWLHLLCAQSICCVAGSSCVYIALEAFHEDKGQTLVRSHFQTKCMTGPIFQTWCRIDQSHSLKLMACSEPGFFWPTSPPSWYTTFYWSRQWFSASSVIFLHHDTVYYHL